MAANKERSFIMVKPDGVHRGVVGEIIKRFEQKGYKLVAMKFVWVGVVTSITWRTEGSVHSPYCYRRTVFHQLSLYFLLSRGPVYPLLLIHHCLKPMNPCGPAA